LVHIDRPAAHVVDHDINHRGAGENVKHNVQGLRDAHSEGDVRSGRIVVRERHRDIEQQAGNEVEQQEWRRVAPQNRKGLGKNVTEAKIAFDHLPRMTARRQERRQLAAFRGLGSVRASATRQH